MRTTVRHVDAQAALTGRACYATFREHESPIGRVCPVLVESQDSSSWIERLNRERRKEGRMSTGQQDEDRQIYKVVVNHEEQYSIWPADRANPVGWRDGGKTGTKVECLAHVKEVWTDMTPLSLRGSTTSS